MPPDFMANRREVNPVSLTWPLVLLNYRARTSSAVCRRCEAGQIAQQVEHRTENPGVGGSIPPLSTLSGAKGRLELQLEAGMNFWVQDR
jgi:hypothetical protein